MGHSRHSHARQLTLLLLAALTSLLSACDPRLGSSEAALACTHASGVAHLDAAVHDTALVRRQSLAVSTHTDGTRDAGHATGEEDESRRELATWAVEAATRPLPSSCDGAVPDRTALVTYTNGHHFDLLVLQRHIAEDAGLQCLLARVLTLCLDDACMELCTQHEIRCRRYKAFDIGAADTRKQVGYRTITWIKWLILDSIVPSVDAALFFDDDVTFLKDPFPLLAPPPFGSGLPHVDLRHQTESGTGCGAPVNGGLLYVRNTAPGRRLLSNMVARRADIEASGDKLDQDYVAAAVSDAGATRCALPKGRFVGHCPKAQHWATPVSEVISYHAHCCANKASKQALVRRLVVAIGGGDYTGGKIKGYAATRTPLMGQVDQQPLVGHTVWNDTCYKPKWGDLVAMRRAWAAVDVALETPLDGSRTQDGEGGDGQGDGAARGLVHRPATGGRRSGDVLRM